MPPKKNTKAAAGEGATANGGGESKGFTGWDHELDMKLLLSICTIPTVPVAEQAELTKHFGCNTYGVKNRIARFRAEQKKVREETGRPLPSAASTDAVVPAKSVKKSTAASVKKTTTAPIKKTPARAATGRKRKIDEVEVEDAAVDEPNDVNDKTGSDDTNGKTGANKTNKPAKKAAKKKARIEVVDSEEEGQIDEGNESDEASNDGDTVKGSDNDPADDAILFSQDLIKSEVVDSD